VRHDEGLPESGGARWLVPGADMTEGRSEISGPPSYVLLSPAGGYFPVPVSVAETVDGSEVPSPVTTSVAV